jgi:arylsulfatase
MAFNHGLRRKSNLQEEEDLMKRFDHSTIAMLLGLALTLILTSVAATAAPDADAAQALKARDRAVHLMDEWMRDPFITLGPDGMYYLSCTRLGNIAGGVQGIQLWKSDDLLTWEDLGTPWNFKQSSWILDALMPSTEKDPFWLWAPEIMFLDGHWVGVHTTNRQMGNLIVSQGADIRGPYTEPMGKACGHRHDPSIFTDDDGSRWLVYNCAKILPLKPDFSGFAGPEVDIGPSNRKLGHEGCLILKIGEKYVLFGTAWSTDSMRHGTYNLYYCTADKVTGPYGPRKFAGRCLGHGTIFQDKEGNWWCTAFLNGTPVPADSPKLQLALPDTAYTLNRQGLTLVPMEVRILDDGDVSVRALDPDYAKPGPEEVQKF